MTGPRLIRPARNLHGAIGLPGDKSISHRYAMLAGLAEGGSRLHNFSTGADCASTLDCLRTLGCEVKRGEDGAVEITGRAGRFAQPAGALDCGNSGSTMRMLAGLLAPQPISCDLTGDGSLSRRPMARVVEPLRKMGAQIAAAEGGRPPLRLSAAATPLRGIDYYTQTPSAQVKTAILFAGMQAEGETSVDEPFRTRDHGELALTAFGAEIIRDRNRVTIRGGQALHGVTASVPGDISSAAFFLCAAALFPESNLVIDGMGMNPTRAAILDVLNAMGTRISILDLKETFGELAGTVKVEPGRLKGVKINGSWTAQLIDELPVLAAIAPYTEQGIEIRDAKELRVKESDRIAAVAKNLKAMGAKVEEFEDGLTVPGGQSLHGAEIDSAGDHRIAMAFAVAALRASGDTLIHGAESASISFPEFWELLEGTLER